LAAKAPQKDVGQMLWQILMPASREGTEPYEVRFFETGEAAIEAFADAPSGSIMQPVLFRLTAESKALAAKRQGHIMTISPVAGVKGIVRPGLAGELPQSRAQIQKLGKVVDKFVRSTLLK
jgi:hypothetical protein